MALLEIRKKSATTWVHIKGGITTILSNGLFRIVNNNFELSESSGIDQFGQEDRLTAITDIRLYDDSVGGSVELFTDSVLFTDRLKALNYPFFKASTSGNSVWGLLTGNITDQTDLINYINENSGGTTAQTNPVENEYADIPQLLSNQVDQTENFFQYVEDASADSSVTENTDSDFPFEAYYEKLTASTASLTDYRLLNSSEVTVLQGSNSYRTFRISGLNDDTTPLTSVTNGRIGVDYNTVTDKVTSVLFDKQFTKVIQNIVGLSGVNDYKFKFYNQNTRRIEVSTITSFSNVGQYQRANLDSTINSTDLSQNHKIEVFFDIDFAGAGTGDMISSTYDPANVNGDAFDMDNMVEGTTKKILSQPERDIINHLTVTQAVDLDTLESDVAANNSKQTNATHTGDVTGDTELSISEEAVDNTKLAHIPTATIKGRSSSGIGDVEDLTPSQVRSIINVEDNATADQTGAEIKTLYEAEADTNAFTDNEKNKVADRLNIQASVTGVFNLDYSAFEEWKLTLTGATTLTESNLPSAGNNKVILLKVTGDFALTYPAGWSTDISGAYEGTVNNTIVVWYIGAGEYKVQITQPD